MTSDLPTAFAVKTYFGWKIRFIDAANPIPEDKPVVKLYHKAYDYDLIKAERDAYKKVVDQLLKERTNVEKTLAQVHAICRPQQRDIRGEQREDCESERTLLSPKSDYD